MATATTGQHKDSFWRGVGAFVGVFALSWALRNVPILNLFVMPVVWLLLFGLFLKAGGYASPRGKIAAAIAGAVGVVAIAVSVLSFYDRFLGAGGWAVPAILMVGAGFKRMAWGYGVTFAVVMVIVMPVYSFFTLVL
ncbi:MAG: hypothetical protein HY680_11110 [Chloroflexi bacterium]|nr:hypothetical protein [Chloroflexota bacterium]